MQKGGKKEKHSNWETRRGDKSRVTMGRKGRIQHIHSGSLFIVVVQGDILLRGGGETPNILLRQTHLQPDVSATTATPTSPVTTVRATFVLAQLQAMD